MRNFLEKHKTSIIIASSILAAGVVALAIFLIMTHRESSDIKKFANDVYSFEYDNTWKIEKTSDTEVELKHQDGKLDISIVALDDHSKYAAMSELVNELMYDVESQNENYNLLSKKSASITKNNLDGYKLLYENDTNQVAISVYKSDDKAIIFLYEADNEFFDIVLDSANNIIYNFALVETKFNAAREISLETKNLSFAEGEDETEKISGETKSYEIANYHYAVNYSIPKEYELFNLNTTYHMYTARSEDYSSRSTITSSVRGRNIYEYIEDDIKPSGERRKKDDSYSEFTDGLQEVSGAQYKTYIYKASYKLWNSYHEDVKIIYGIAKNATFEIEIEMTGTKVSDELINSIVINSVKNYASNIDLKKEGGNTISTMKRKFDSGDGIQEITLKVPEKYTQTDTDNDNLYERRRFVGEYDEDLKEYKYEIKYEIRIGSVEDIMKSGNTLMTSSYGEMIPFTQATPATYHGKNFNVSTGAYDKLAGVPFTNIGRTKYRSNQKLLVYVLENNYNLVITISGNNQPITEEIINDFTNFTVK